MATRTFKPKTEVDIQMSTKKIGRALAIIGGAGALISTIVDYIGLGDGGIQAAQILGILAGLIIALFGLLVATQLTEKQIDIGSSLLGGARRMLNMPVDVWFIIGFLIVYVLLFIYPVFLNTDRTMVYFNRFLPNMNPIGADMNYTLEHVKTWVTTRESPYPASHYPPLTYVLLSPLTLFNYPASYIASTYLTLFSYVVLTLIIPVLFSGKKNISSIVLLSVTGLFSYGFLFELERAQYYTMAFLLCMLAIFIFHYHHEFRYLAYVLFSFSVQLKIAPIFFIPMFIKDWQDWKGNLKRMIGLGLLNLSLLFVLGYRNFLYFINSLMSRIKTPTFLWNGNHSLSNFVFNFAKEGYGLFPENWVAIIQQNVKLFERFLLAVIVLCLLSIIIHSYLSGKGNFNPYLLLMCTLCALVIPVSVDYTLPMLVAPLSIFLVCVPQLSGSSGNKMISNLLVLIISISYASLLYPFKYKPDFLSNGFPALFLILIAVTLLYFLQRKSWNNKRVNT